jgi:hypothetical protein
VPPEKDIEVVIVLHLATIKPICLIMTKEEYSRKLEAFVPERTAEHLTEWIFQRRINLKITQGRKTKLGDYKISYKPNSIPTISINGDQNKYSFLLTLLHEFAHAQVFEKYGAHVKPHGEEWKEEYRGLIIPYFEMDIFPEPLRSTLLKHFINPKASSHADLQLVKALSEFDTPSDKPILRLEDLEEGEAFVISGKKLIKGEKRRTRYMCYELGNPKRKYTVSALAIVDLLT